MSAAPLVAQTFNPAIAVADPEVAWWLRQATLRLRREVAWCWHQRGERGAMPEERLPPASDALLESLDLTRYHAHKQHFFAQDEAARYLSERLAEGLVEAAPRLRPGRWAGAAKRLELSAAAQFILALALAARADAALGAVCAACNGDASRPWPTLALAQRLWDEPLEIAACVAASHPLFACGLIAAPGDGSEALDWQHPLEMPSAVARALLLESALLPARLRPLQLGGDTPDIDATVGDWLAGAVPGAMQIVPLIGPVGGRHAELAAACARRCGRPLAQVAEGTPASAQALLPLAAAAWLHETDLLLPEDFGPDSHGHATPWYEGLAALPLRWYLPLADAQALRGLPAAFVAPALRVPALDHGARADYLRQACGVRGAAFDAAIGDIARRFRLERRPLERAVQMLRANPGRMSVAALESACRSQVTVQLGTLAQRVDPRFALDEVVLPAQQAQQLKEIVGAMGALATVHYEWGSARAWNEAGLSVLFCGAPGTGKTMAAEAIADALGLPMYRVDLSQVVNKYIGETEKNLKQIFDAAEAIDLVLLFDEADALFGRRTEVKDAHDRFANIEVSYLLERMERFKGLAVLATNRRKDLDDAFTRRLRYVVEFPLPSVAERLRIWRQVFPDGVDTSLLDLPYLAQQFELAGGHIRSIAFNACLQGAAREGRQLAMATVLTQVRRELEKMGRPNGPALFGRHAHLLGVLA